MIKTVSRYYIIPVYALLLCALPQPAIAASRAGHAVRTLCTAARKPIVACSRQAICVRALRNECPLSTRFKALTVSIPPNSALVRYEHKKPLALTLAPSPTVWHEQKAPTPALNLETAKNLILVLAKDGRLTKEYLKRFDSAQQTIIKATLSLLGTRSDRHFEEALFKALLMQVKDIDTTNFSSTLKETYVALMACNPSGTTRQDWDVLFWFINIEEK